MNQKRQESGVLARRRGGAAGGGGGLLARSRPGLLAAWFLVLALPLAVLAQEAAGRAEGGAAAAPAGAQRPFIYFLFGGGGLVGVLCTTPILLMSVIAMALVVENLITIRRSVLMPPGLAEEVHELVAAGNVVHAEQQCKLRPSFLSELLQAGLGQMRLGYSAVEKAMEDACHGQAARLFRRIEFLSVVANISVMLGLFGTVVGLVIAFKRVADTQGVARASDLAGGIYLAMMTTVEGLAVAIPCVAAYAIFRHRADQLVADAALTAEYAFAGYKRARLMRRSTETARSTRVRTGS